MPMLGMRSPPLGTISMDQAVCNKKADTYACVDAAFTGNSKTFS